MLLYRFDKKKGYPFVDLRYYKYSKNFFFNISRVPGNYWLRSPRYFANINLGLISHTRNNTTFTIGIGFGKHQLLLWYQS